MVQQMAIYDHGCQLMVGTPLSYPDKRNNIFNRMQVRIFSALDDRYLTRTSDSRKVCPQSFPQCEWGRIPARRAQRLSQRNTWTRPERDRTLGKGL